MSRFSAIPKMQDTSAIACLVLFTIAAALGTALALDVGAAFALSWLPSGIGLGVLIAVGVRLWPGVAIGTYCAGMMLGLPIAQAVSMGLTTALAVVVGALIFRDGGFRPALDRFRDVIMLVLVAIPVSSAVSVATGISVLNMLGTTPGAPWSATIILWVEGYIVSCLMAAPAIMSWVGRPLPIYTSAKALELAALFCLTGFLALLSLTPNIPYPAQLGLVGSCFPLVVWASLRFDLRTTTAIVTLIMLTAMAAGGLGLGPLKVLPADQQWSALCVFAFFFTSSALVLGVLTQSRQRVEAELRASQQRLQDIADSATDFFWETDAQHRFTYLSDRLATALGVKNDDLLGSVMTEQALFAVPGADMEQFRTQLKAKHPFRNLRVAQAPSSSVKLVFALSGQPVMDANGNFAGYRGAATDISDQLRAEEELLQALKMETVSKLSGGLAHEFNNLLAIIVGNLELSLGAVTLENKARPSMERALSAADRAATLVHRLLAYSRRQALQPRVTDVNHLINGLADMLNHSIDPGVHLHLELDPDAWALKVDPAQLEMAVMNLALNAVDAMPGGGDLTIETYNAELEHPEEGSDGEIFPGEYLTINVRDTGTGMAAEVIDRMFEPFFTTKDVGKGSGLGLSMVHGFVNQSGGHVDVASTIGEGTSITLLLPRHPGTANDAEEPSAALDAEPETT
ncbi:MAG: ATP-binding protein [Alphaproteobacteria bacterium]